MADVMWALKLSVKDHLCFVKAFAGEKGKRRIREESYLAECNAGLTAALLEMQ